MDQIQIISLKNLWFVALLCMGLHAWSQTNLVPNGGFEGLTSCQSSLPTAYDNSPNWEKPTGSTGTPDVLQKECYNIPAKYNHSGCGGGSQSIEYMEPGFSPSEGWKFGAIVLYQSNSSDWREYMSVELSSPLEEGRCYKFSFKVRNGGGLIPYNYGFGGPVNVFRKYYSNNLGAYFSASKPTQSGTGVINVTPQVNIATLINIDAVWAEYVFYICAEGGEEWLTIGNFYSDEETTIYDYNGEEDCGSGNNAYYCLDEIALYAVSDFHKYIENTTYSTTALVENFQTITAGYSVDPTQTNGNVTVQSNADVTYKAMQKVNLKPGFHANHDFHAYIDPVTPCGSDCQPESGKHGKEIHESALTPIGSPVRIFPNPTHDVFRVENAGAGLIILTDLSGKLMLKKSISGNAEEVIIDIRDLPNGIYLMTIEQQNHLETMKVVKQ